MIKILIDNKIPFIRGVLEPFGRVEYLPGNEFSNFHLKDVDAIIIRTRTKCNTDLLHGTKIKFIATATIGFDHIDTDYCKENNIFWTNSPGCNAGSVAQYIASALANISTRNNYNLRKKTLGIIGVGHVGRKVIQVAESFGMKVLLNDPPRQRTETKNNFVDLKTIKSEADIITLHVPLNMSGHDKTYHLVDWEFLKSCKKDAIIINSSRGEVVNTSHLKEALKNYILGGAVLDVWENEPEIDSELLSQVIFGTPHIAGYSADGKANATSFVVNAISKHFGFDLQNWIPEELPALDNKVTIIKEGNQNKIVEVLNLVYNIGIDSKALLGNPELFEQYRNNYPVRREYGFYKLQSADYSQEEIKILGNLGFKLV